MVGDVGIGGAHPIRIQSMTTPATTDTAATVAQMARLVEAGCEIVRLTVPTSADAENLPNIRREMRRLSIRVPLVADIHFTPAAALKAVEHVEKIRINPGNFADKKRFAVREYTDAAYATEIERIDRALAPLVARCRERGVAMRIGTNHGSLSDRIMNRYGDTPEGMVESALEFVRLCEARGFRDLVLSMKASNPRVVLEAYRLLVARMDAAAMDYPLHLGVTEAGEGNDGRIKSAIGIGVLLHEGIGDTVRVSLTEDPVAEIPVARALVASVAPRREQRTRVRPVAPQASGRSARTRRALRVGPVTLGGGAPVAVIVPVEARPDALETVRREVDAVAGPRVSEETRADLVAVAVETEAEAEAADLLRRSMEIVAPRTGLVARVAPGFVERRGDADLVRLFGAGHALHVTVSEEAERRVGALLDRLLGAAETCGRAILLEAGSANGDTEEAIALAVAAARRAADRNVPLLLALDPSLSEAPIRAVRRLDAALEAAGLPDPIVLVDRRDVAGRDALVGTATHVGGPLCDGIGDAVCLETGNAVGSWRLAFDILQAARVRITKTEFISCPSCGRTLFDLEATTASIRARTRHLRGLKIAVMGCVVNGPGEMADADFGYVGWGEDKIALFVGKEMVERDIPSSEAADRLVALIRRHGKWIEPPDGGEA